MITAKIDELQLFEVATDADPTIRSRVDFPLFAGKGTSSSAVVYFEIEPGHRLGMHRDSAEEVVLILQGEAEVVVDGARGRLSAGSLALVPAMAPHDLHSVGEETLRVVGFFAGSTLVHTFHEPLIPGSDIAIFIHGQVPGNEVLGGSLIAAPEPVG